eukprot:gene5913-8156_t
MGGGVSIDQSDNLIDSRELQEEDNKDIFMEDELYENTNLNSSHILGEEIKVLTDLFLATIESFIDNPLIMKSDNTVEIVYWFLSDITKNFIIPYYDQLELRLYYDLCINHQQESDVIEVNNNMKAMNALFTDLIDKVIPSFDMNKLQNNNCNSNIYNNDKVYVESISEENIINNTKNNDMLYPIVIASCNPNNCSNNNLIYSFSMIISSTKNHNDSISIGFSTNYCDSNDNNNNNNNQTILSEINNLIGRLPNTWGIISHRHSDIFPSEIWSNGILVNKYYRSLNIHDIISFFLDVSSDLGQYDYGL